MIPALRILIGASFVWYMIRQCRKPTGPLGTVIARTMNRSHAALTAWGLEHVSVNQNDVILDVGCGGGRTVERLSEMAPAGKICGVDYAGASVATSRQLNAAAIDSGRVMIQRASVSHLPFADNTFHLVTAVETHYYWPDLPADLREIHRVLKPGCPLLIVAEACRSGKLGMAFQLVMKPLGGVVLSPAEHRDLFQQAGFSDVAVSLHRAGWIAVTGRKAPL